MTDIMAPYQSTGNRRLQVTHPPLQIRNRIATQSSHTFGGVLPFLGVSTADNDSASPSKANLLAIASPSPCVPPVITAIVFWFLKREPSVMPGYFAVGFKFNWPPEPQRRARQDRIKYLTPRQLLAYLRLTGLRLGLLINFGEAVLKNGVHRVVNNL